MNRHRKLPYYRGEKDSSSDKDDSSGKKQKGHKKVAKTGDRSSKCNRDISFRFDSGLNLGTQYCAGSCLSAVYDEPPLILPCDASDKSQSLTIQPVPGSPAVQIKSDYTHQCVGLPECVPRHPLGCNIPEDEECEQDLIRSTSMDCSDPNTEMVFVRGSFMAWNCWKEGIADLHFDPADDHYCESGTFDDDGLFGAPILFLDPCVFDNH